jgi:HEAT repeat protein
MPACILLILAVLTGPVLPAGSRSSALRQEQGNSDAELVAEFRKYFKKYKDAPTRVEAVRSLAGIESSEVVEVLVPVLASEEPEVARAAIDVLSAFRSRPPLDRLLAEFEVAKGESSRGGLVDVLGAYRGVSAALVPALQDSAWTVRRRACLALGKSGEAALDVELSPLASDGEPAVRCAALEALASLKSPLVLKPAIADLEHSVWQVRLSAIQALGRVRHVDSIAPLIRRLEIEEGRLVEDIGRSLGEITGRQYGIRLEGWKRFWETTQGRFQIPTDEELARMRARAEVDSAAYQPKAAPIVYHGVATQSRSILFVMDVSGSMEQEVIEKERYRDGGYPSFRRVDVVKTELARTVERLEPNCRFNVLSFATKVSTWKKDLVVANVLNKSSAATWIERLDALGGTSKEDLAAVGLFGSSELESGKTNTYGALMAALGVAGRGTKDQHYATAIDTIFFLSDGRPSTGDFVDTSDILREVRAANELRKVVIHTIAIGEFEKDFMRQLAEQNGGVFVDLGR